LLAERELIPFVDLAYLGYAEGLQEDARGLRTIFEHCPEGLVTTSFSKNFSLYNERIGLLSYVSADADATKRCVSRTRTYVRRLWTSPPAHGSRIVAAVLSDSGLRQIWAQEVDNMRLRMRRTRQEFSAALQARQVDMTIFPGLAVLNGMFALTRLTENQVARLREEQHIYMLPNGRISITGLTTNTISRVAEAIAQVVRV
jgi:aspartate/tyrosine/aromatic aminotransferase